MATPDLRLNTTNRPLAQSPSVISGSIRQSPAAPRDTLVQQQTQSNSKAGNKGFFASFMKAIAFPFSAIAAVAVGIAGLFTVVAMCFRLFSNKPTVSAPPVVNRNTDVIEKARTVKLFQELIAEKMRHLNASEKSQFRQEMRSLSPSLLQQVTSAAIGMIVAAGHRIEDSGSSDGFRLSWRGFLRTNGISDMEHYFPKIMRRYTPQILSLRRAYDDLPSDVEKGYFKDQYWRNTLTATPSRDNSDLMHSRHILVNRILEEDASLSFRNYIQEAAACYLRDNL